MHPNFPVVSMGAFSLLTDTPAHMMGIWNAAKE